MTQIVRYERRFIAKKYFWYQYMSNKREDHNLSQRYIINEDNNISDTIKCYYL